MKRRGVLVAAVLVLALLGAACGGDDDGGTGELTGDGGEQGDLTQLDPGDCIAVDVAVSSEKIDLLTDLANEFNGSDAAQVDGRCIGDVGCEEDDEGREGTEQGSAQT